ncbi:MAG: dTDP-glucose 4,6-dehydratase [Spirochaetes bacterium GWF1_51_8]|nr:MAG: dTDP-glucose 4,6-dehydratase [Spirochaetes bacterium GWF1_51_8]
MREFKTILVTGGAGFIGSNFIRHVFRKSGYKGKAVNLDKLTYAGNLLSLTDIEKEYGGTRYFFEHVDICDKAGVMKTLKDTGADCIVHFAAESHVDRSITGPGEFIQTNLIGTFNLLEAAREFWKDRKDVLFHHISTDEVYGSLGDIGYFFEDTAYDPRSPYSASKAGSDHLVMAYHHTYGLPVTLSNCSNNYGPYHFPEKLIPLMILNCFEGKPLPVYGDGMNVRDWLYVEDHASAIWKIITDGKIGDKYNVGGENERPNLEVVNLICEIAAGENGKPKDEYKSLITYVKDRPGHDRRYAINCDKLKKELGWKQSVTFEDGLRQTVRWYLNNPEWIESVRSGEYRKWIEKNYAARD